MRICTSLKLPFAIVAHAKDYRSDACCAARRKVFREAHKAGVSMKALAEASGMTYASVAAACRVAS